MPTPWTRTCANRVTLRYLENVCYRKTEYSQQFEWKFSIRVTTNAIHQRVSNLKNNKGNEKKKKNGRVDCRRGIRNESARLANIYVDEFRRVKSNEKMCKK